MCLSCSPVALSTAGAPPRRFGAGSTLCGEYSPRNLAATLRALSVHSVTPAYAKGHEFTRNENCWEQGREFQARSNETELTRVSTAVPPALRRVHLRRPRRVWRATFRGYKARQRSTGRGYSAHSGSQAPCLLGRFQTSASRREPPLAGASVQRKPIVLNTRRCYTQPICLTGWEIRFIEVRQLLSIRVHPRNGTRLSWRGADCWAILLDAVRP
jgi:hypothetical protein